MTLSAVCAPAVCFSWFRTTGKERDAESGNDYFGARYYASSMGRFMIPDPSGLKYADPTNPQSLNLYTYVLNNPLVNIDPTGKTCQTNSSDGTVYDDEDGKGCATVDQQNAQAPPSVVVHGGPDAAAQEVNDALDDFFGNGAKPRLIYQPTDPFTLDFQQSLAMQGIIAGITADCSKTSGAAPVGHWEAFVNTAIDGLMGGSNGNGAGFGTPEAQVGGFYSTYSRAGDVVNITVQNPIDLNSLLYDHSAKLGIKNPTSGPTGTVNQELHITAPDPCVQGK